MNFNSRYVVPFGESFTLRKITFAKSNRYQPMVKRSLTADYNGELQRELGERLHLGKLKSVASAPITAGALTGIAGRIIQPDAFINNTSGSAIPLIANSWDGQRLVFNMQLEHQSPNGLTIYYLTGFTDYDGSSSTGFMNVCFDPKMNLRVNSVMEVKLDVVKNNATGQSYQVPRLVGCYELAKPELVDAFGFGDWETGTETMIRPSDLVMANAVRRMDGEHVIDDDFDDVPTFHVSEEPAIKLVNTKHMHSVGYLTDTLKCLREGYINQHGYHGFEETRSTPWFEAEAMLKTPTINSGNNTVWAFLNTKLTRGLFGNSAEVTWGDLLRYDSTIDDRAELLQSREAQRQTLFGGAGHMVESEAWNGGDNTTVIVNQILNSSVAILNACSLMDIRFSITNMGSAAGGFGEEINTPYGNFYFLYGERATPITNIIETRTLVDNFIKKFVNEVLLDITFNNQISIALNLTASINSETTIEISFDGKNQERFVAPAFTSSLYNQMVGTNVQRKTNMASHLHSIADSLFSSSTVDFTKFEYPTGKVQDFGTPDNFNTNTFEL